MNKKNILITGASGFIGTWLIDSILENKKFNDFTIYGVDIKKKKFNNKIIFKCMDISDPSFVKFVKNIKPIKCFHLAAQTSSIISEKKSLLDIKSNIIGTQNLANSLKYLPKCEINFTSSMSVYGDSFNKFSGPNPNPKSIYGISKLSGEYILKRLSNYGHCVRIFRLFNVYGNGQDLDNFEQGMLSIFVAQAIKNKTINVKGSPNRTRDFIYIEDVIENLISPVNKLKSGTYDLGSSNSISVRDLIKLIIKATNFIGLNKPKIKYSPGFREDIKFSRARKNKKIVIRTKLNDKIFSFVEWCQKNI